MKKIKLLREHLKNAKITRSPNYTEVHIPHPAFAKSIKEAAAFLSKYPPNESFGS